MAFGVALCYLFGMGKPVKLSDALLREARVAGAAMGRSMAGQVEFWASLGREMERVMTGGVVMKVREKSLAAELSDALESVDQPAGREKLRKYLESTPFPHYEAHPEKPRVFLRTEADGSRSEGRFVGREFVVERLISESEAA